jgi:hypothetical protein
MRSSFAWSVMLIVHSASAQISPYKPPDLPELVVGQKPVVQSLSEPEQQLKKAISTIDSQDKPALVKALDAILHQFPEVGIRLTQVTPRCSMWPQWKNTPEILRSWKRSSARKRHAGRT